MLRAFRRRTMTGYNFTERVRKVLAMAREEAARLHHEYVGTEHVLLGIIREGEGVAATVLQNLSIELDDIHQKIEQGVKKGHAGQTTGPDLPYTSRAKKVLELAMDEAQELHHAYVGTEHLLLGLLREERGIAAQVLVDAGVTLDRARGETLRVLGTDMPAASPASQPSRQASMRGWPPPQGDSPSASMAASVIELLAQDAGVNAVFAAQGIDVAKLVVALRTFTPPAPGNPPS